jgi:hypothetical protein
MEAFTEHLKASALQAAKAAQAIATTGLDEMAAEDEYVQSEGYNGTRKLSKKQSNCDDLSSTRSTHSTYHQSLDHRKQELVGDRPSSSRAGSSQPLKPPPSSSVVADRKEENSNARRKAIHRPEDQTYLLSSSSDDEDQDAENDPILSILRKEKSTSEHRESKRKDAHRFMDDLESRISMPMEPDMPPVPSYSYSSTNSPPSIAEGAIGISAWLSTAATTIGIPTQKKVLTMPAMALAPLSRQKPRPTTGENQVELVSSTAMLGESELQQLEQLRSLERQSAQGPIRQLYDRLLVQHRREMFIVLTLVLCAYVYFHAARI